MIPSMKYIIYKGNMQETNIKAILHIAIVAQACLSHNYII